MLKLIIGRAGSGKTDYVIDQINTLSTQGKTGITLIVPEQYSHEAERMLCARCGEKINLHGEVLSFSRLCSRVFAQTGGDFRGLLDPGGRILLMARAMDSALPSLHVYGRHKNSTGFLRGMLQTIDELKSACVTPEQIMEVFSDRTGRIAEKMRDIALLYSAYEGNLAQIGADDNDRLALLAEKIGQSSYCTSGSHIFLDGFRSFTGRQWEVVKNLIACGADVSVALTCDGLDGEEEHFSEARKTARALLRLCPEQSRVEILKSRKTGFGDTVERYLFSGAPKTCEKSDSVRLYHALTDAQECENAAARILELVQSGASFQQILLICCDDSALDLAESTLNKYGIPTHLNRKTDLLSTEPVAVINQAMEIILSNWEYASVFRYLKTGLTGFASDELDELENYVLQWSIRGKLWTSSEPWVMPPEGYSEIRRDDSQETLDRLNALRFAITAPLLKLERAFKRADNCLAMLKALYTFMTDISLPERLMQRKQQDPDCVYDQIWDAIVRAMEQFSRLMGDRQLDAETFAALWRLLISQYSVGMIPVRRGTVLIGSMSNTLRRDVHHCVVIGATDRALPRTPSSYGILSPYELDLVSELGLSLPQTGTDMTYRAMNEVYSSLTLPSETLTVSYCEADGQRPSYLFQRLCNLFDTKSAVCDIDRCRTFAPEPCFELAVSSDKGHYSRQARAYFSALPEYAPRLDAAARAAASDPGRLTKQSARRLYGDKIDISASKADKYYECRYKYFLQYGLKAKPRKLAEMDAPVYGTFIHYVLQKVVSDIKKAGGFQNVTREQCRKLTGKYVEEYSQNVLHSFAGKTERFIYLFKRLREDAIRIVLTVFDEMCDSDFFPVEFELHIGKGAEIPPPELTDGDVQMVLDGYVDRVDGWIHDGKLYLRVVDYKTGKKTLDMSKIWYGRELQMLMYLFAIEKGGSDYFRMPIEPAGVLYMPAQNNMLTLERSVSDDELRQEHAKGVKRSGLLLQDEEVISAMAHDSGKVYLPVSFSKSGEPGGSSLVTAEQLGALSMHIDELLLQIGRELRSGALETDPFYENVRTTACVTCDYRRSCHFDEENGGEYRKLKIIKSKDVWKMIMEKQEARKNG